MEPLSARWRLQCEPRATARVEFTPQPPRVDEGAMSKSADCNFPHVLIFEALFFYTKKHDFCGTLLLYEDVPLYMLVLRKLNVDWLPGRRLAHPANLLSPNYFVRPANQVCRAKQQTNFVCSLSNKRRVALTYLLDVTAVSMLAEIIEPSMLGQQEI